MIQNAEISEELWSKVRELSYAANHNAMQARILGRIIQNVAENNDDDSLDKCWALGEAIRHFAKIAEDKCENIPLLIHSIRKHYDPE